MATDKDALLNQLKISDTDRQQAPGRWPRQLAFLGAGAVILAGLAAYSGLFESPETGASNSDTVAVQDVSAPPQSAGTAPPGGSAGNSEQSSRPLASIAASQPSTTSQRGADGAVLNASGYVVARRIATVSAQLTGLITDVQVEEGLRVDKGQILARLDDAVAKVNLSLAEARIDVSKGSLQRIQASLAEARRVLKRTESLNARDFSTEAALTRAQADVETLTAQVIEARATLKVAELDAALQRETVDDHIIRAPFAGVVIDKSAQPGEIISPVSAGGGFTRTGICTIVDMDSLEVEVDVNEAFISRVSADQDVRANLDAYPDWDIPARVIAIVPTADRNKATVRVRIALESRDPRILPDMGIKVAFLADDS